MIKTEHFTESLHHSRVVGFMLITGIFFISSCAQLGTTKRDMSQEVLSEQKLNELIQEGRRTEAVASLDRSLDLKLTAMLPDGATRDRDGQEHAMPGSEEPGSVMPGSTENDSAEPGSSAKGWPHQPKSGNLPEDSWAPLFELIAKKADLLHTWPKDAGTPQKHYASIRAQIDRAGFHQPETNKKLEELWSRELQSGVQWLQQHEEVGNGIHTLDGLNHFQWAIDLMPDSLQAYRLKSTAHYKLGQTHLALDTLEKLHQRAPLFGELGEKLAYLYLESGRVAKAEELYRKLLDEDPGNRLLTHGWINSLIVSGRGDVAIAELEQLTSGDPGFLPYFKVLLSERVKLAEKLTYTAINAAKGAHDSLRFGLMDFVLADSARTNGTRTDSAQTDDRIANPGGLGAGAKIYADSVKMVISSLQKDLERVEAVQSEWVTEEDPRTMAVFWTGLGERVRDLSEAARLDGENVKRGSVTAAATSPDEATVSDVTTAPDGAAFAAADSDSQDRSVSQMLHDTGSLLLAQAIPYWQKMSEIDPENKRYAQKLYDLYNALSMEDEADRVYQRFNF